MILKNLTLTNFRKFKKTYIEFPDGVTCVVGFNGVGKSTIFEAIAWVLYGSSAARTSADQIKTEGASNKEPCRVELEFIFNESNYRIVREMTGKNYTANASATVDGREACNGAEAVTQLVLKKLGMDFKSFYTSIFAKQKELNSLSNMNASERRPLILRMLGIDALDNVIKEIKTDKKNKETIVEKLQNQLYTQDGENKIEIYQKETQDLSEQKNQLFETIKKQKNEIQKFGKQVEKTQKELIELKTKYEKLDAKKEKLEKEKEQFEQKNKLSGEIKKLKEKIKERDLQIKKQEQEKTKFSDVTKELEKTEKKIEEIKNIQNEHIKKIEQKNTLMQRLKKDISEIEYKTKRIKKLGPEAECPTCNRKLSDHYDKLLKKFEINKKQKEKEIKDYLKKVSEIEDKTQQTNKAYEALNKKIFYFQKQQKNIDKIETTVENIESEIKKEKNELLLKEKKVEELDKVDFNKEEFDKIKKDIKKSYEMYQKKQVFFNKQKDILNQKRIELEKKQGNIKIFEKDIKNYSEKIQELEEYSKRIENEKTESRNLNMLTEVMSSFRTYLISRIRPTLSLYASDFFRQLTNGKYSEIDLDEKYNLMVYDNGKKYGIERFSGGEEDLANLCLRLAISEVITERAGGVFNFIILDEIFGSQDYIRRQNIIDALSSLSSKYRQIFLITHVDEIKNDMENIISVYENIDETSQVKIE